MHPARVCFATTPANELVVGRFCPRYCRPLLCEYRELQIQYGLPLIALLPETSCIKRAVQWTLSAALADAQARNRTDSSVVKDPAPNVPLYLRVDPKPLACHRARLRLNNSRLNFDLHRRNLAPSPLCSHCNLPETASHVLGACSLYAEARLKCFQDLSTLNHHLPVTTDLLLGFLPVNRPIETSLAILKLSGSFILSIQQIRNF